MSLSSNSSSPWVVLALFGVVSGLALVEQRVERRVEQRMELGFGGAGRESGSSVRLLAARPTPARWGPPIQPIRPATGLHPERVALGERLFHDVRLSLDGKTSCATCHVLSEGGDDGRQFSVMTGGVSTTLNAPTVFNATFNFRQFWNGRVRTLDEQLEGPVAHGGELGLGWVETVGCIASDERYASSFLAAYGSEPTEELVRDALVTFEESLVTPGSPFDRYLTGDSNALSAEALSGYEFFDEIGCITCHQGVNVGGNMFQPFGLMTNPDALDDTGAQDQEPEHDVFKVPSLRNVALTGPYFHDGRVENLHEAVRIMARAQLAEELSDRDVARLVAFLESLTGQHPALKAGR